MTMNNCPLPSPASKHLLIPHNTVSESLHSEIYYIGVSLIHSLSVTLHGEWRLGACALGSDPKFYFFMWPWAGYLNILQFLIHKIGWISVPFSGGYHKNYVIRIMTYVNSLYMVIISSGGRISEPCEHLRARCEKPPGWKWRWNKAAITSYARNICLRLKCTLLRLTYFGMKV